jgi:NTE family protein
MALDTLIAHSFAPEAPRAHEGRALVLMGGGARTAYQAGVLRGIGALLARHAPQQRTFPFQILLGTSAGALNASYLASQANDGVAALGRLAEFWRKLRSTQVYRLGALHWLPPNLLVSGWTLARQVRRHRALLDTMPLVDTLHRHIDLAGIERALAQGALKALAVTASSYTTGEHWTFCQVGTEHAVQPWHRPGRRASLQPVTIEHLMASSAIPFLFPAVPLWVDGHKEYFGDGSMRQLSPLSPAIQLGARKVLVLGVGQPQRAGLSPARGSGEPTAGTIAGHAMASVFHDTLLTDVEQAQRVSQTLKRLPPELAAALPYRPLEVLALQPSHSLDELALKHADALPVATRHTLSGMGALGSGAGSAASTAALASYLLFEPPFVNALMEWGERDALARRDELLDFFDVATAPGDAIIGASNPTGNPHGKQP